MKQFKSIKLYTNDHIYRFMKFDPHKLIIFTNCTRLRALITPYSVFPLECWWPLECRLLENTLLIPEYTILKVKIRSVNKISNF